jgi:hypothetical protein
MSSKEKELDLNVDVRLTERLLKRGLMTRRDHEKLVKQLPDVKAKARALGDVNAHSSSED